MPALPEAGFAVQSYLSLPTAAQHRQCASPQSESTPHAAEQRFSVPNCAQIALMQSPAPPFAHESPSRANPAVHEPRIGTHWNGGIPPVPIGAQVNCGPHFDGSAVHPAPVQPGVEPQSEPQNRSPRYGEPGVRFETQRLFGCAVVAQSSSVWQAAQRLPSVDRAQARWAVSQVDPSPHSRWTAAASVAAASQYPAQVPLFGTHWLGPVPWPERSTQENPPGQSVSAAHCTAQKVS